MCEKWVRATILQHLPEKVVQALVVELKRATSVEEIYSIINTYMFDHKIGLPRGQASSMLYLTENQNNEEDSSNTVKDTDATQNNTQTNTEGKDSKRRTDEPEEDRQLYVASKGDGKGKTCWNCGEKGHSQRECPRAKGNNIVAALKGKGKGKGKKGKDGYKGGYGKGQNQLISGTRKSYRQGKS